MQPQKGYSVNIWLQLDGDFTLLVIAIRLICNCTDLFRLVVISVVYDEINKQ